LQNQSPTLQRSWKRVAREEEGKHGTSRWRDDLRSHMRFEEVYLPPQTPITIGAS
jgi:hypothetical protein